MKNLKSFKNTPAEILNDFIFVKFCTALIYQVYLIQPCLDILFTLLKINAQLKKVNSSLTWKYGIVSSRKKLLNKLHFLHNFSHSWSNSCIFVPASCHEDLQLFWAILDWRWSLPTVNKKRFRGKNGHLFIAK